MTYWRGGGGIEERKWGVKSGGPNAQFRKFWGERRGAQLN